MIDFCGGPDRHSMSRGTLADLKNASGVHLIPWEKADDDECGSTDFRMVRGRGVGGAV